MMDAYTVISIILAAEPRRQYTSGASPAKCFAHLQNGKIITQQPDDTPCSVWEIFCLSIWIDTLTHFPLQAKLIVLLFTKFFENLRQFFIQSGCSEWLHHITIGTRLGSGNDIFFFGFSSHHQYRHF